MTNYIEYCKKNNDNEDCCNLNTTYQDRFDSMINGNLKFFMSTWSIILVIVYIPMVVITSLLMFNWIRIKRENIDPQLLNPDGLASLNKHIVIHPYTPVIEDEIKLNIGDIIIVQDIFNDGWIRGINCTTNSEGTFPVACITPYDIGNYYTNGGSSRSSSHSYGGGDGGSDEEDESFSVSRYYKSNPKGNENNIYYDNIDYYFISPIKNLFRLFKK